MTLGSLTHLRALYVSVVPDCLDRIGLRNQVMAPRIRPLTMDHRAAGYARTVQAGEAHTVPEDPADHYRNEIAAVDSLHARDVLVASTREGSCWGELLTTAAIARGTSGIVADAYTRDVRATLDLGFLTFVARIDARDSLGRIDVTAIGEPIECGGVTVHNSDLVLADYDGAVVVPGDVADRG